MVKKLLLFTGVLFILILSGCGSQKKSFTAQEFAAFYQEKPEEAKKLENREITIAGRVLWKGKLKDSPSYTLTLWQEGNPQSERRVIQITLPQTEEKVVNELKINDIVEAKGKLKLGVTLRENYFAHRIEATALSTKRTVEGSFPEIRAFGVGELLDLYKKNNSEYQKLISHTIKISGPVVRTGQFTNTPDLYIVAYTDYFSKKGVIISVPTREKGRVNELKEGHFFEAYGILQPVIVQDSGLETLMISAEEFF